ncbi:double-strand break repair protein AddB [Flavimaricola marinus]|uniref:PD-(D/E)XK nuclease superfamily protein n=1 Tax=Flavimaricola marinus TaxID=1819565 RepID=A0A238LE52_9RHOB|nr:double-strand break repair protein AddB [Flavimaricola marinus]SMY07210.1 PD-(D/E)XK nuclease superfamily protein [Flavimaricola marinus]
MLFSDTETPRLFGLPPGADFAQALVDGLIGQMQDPAPEALGRVTLFVNTRRMQRRIREVFDAGPARILPRIRLITDLSRDPAASDLPPAISPLRRRLELSQLVAGLLDRTEGLAPRAALYDLADSLARLMDEMQGEGVTPADIAALDVTDQSGHWARSLEFLTIVQKFFGGSDEAPDPERRQRAIIERLITRWRTEPPKDPIIVAGSTGSRGATALLIEAVAKLPQGAVILPGYDFDMPAPVWERLDDALTGEDHPQFRFRKLMQALDLTPSDIRAWPSAPPPSPARNKLISLSLRPAPVTDQWHSEGPSLGHLPDATKGLTLLEAPSPRIEAEAIALRLRHAVEQGITAALITPDRGLTRQVAAALDRWEITPDDSAGMPLPLSPPGRMLRQVGNAIGERLTSEPILSILKHPLCNTADRGKHVLRTHDLELYLRRKGVAFPTAETMHAFAESTDTKAEDRRPWAAWLAGLLDRLANTGTLPLAEHLAQHIGITEAFCAGPDTPGSGELWEEAAGRKARALCDDLIFHADAGGDLTVQDYNALFYGVLSTGEVRDRDAGHPQVLIWGTLEARVQGADLMILAGLNEGTWPESPAPDPWLNRTMRRDAGLLLPERRIGLSAHDYMQAVAGAEVWITRSIRSDDADTVASRWINRLTNLMAGLPEQHGPEALTAMRNRAAPWIAGAIAQSDADRVDPAIRPSPRPPVESRPKELPVTAIGTLTRDPYSIYARYILRLRALDGLSQEPDAPLRGTVLHKVFEAFLKLKLPPDHAEAEATLLRVAGEVLDAECPWPTVRYLWRARIGRVADWFLTTEVARQAQGTPELFEKKGEAKMADLDFTLTAKADRIDIAADGSALIYDYKTGAPPSIKEQLAFEKQLLLTAALVEEGGFKDIGPSAVQGAAYIGLGSTPNQIPAPLDQVPPEDIWNELRDLVRLWSMPSQGYSALFRPKLVKYEGDYDHLSRRGEWDLSTKFTHEDVP